MFNLEPAVMDALSHMIANPTLLSLFIGVLVGLCYYFGSIINANNWQYNNAERFGQIYRGFDFIVMYIFFPIIIIYVIDSYLFDVGSLLQKVPLYLYFTLIIVLWFSLIVLDGLIYNKLRNFDDVFISNIGVRFARIGEWKYVLFLSNYGILILTTDVVLILTMAIFDFIIISKLARLSNLNHQGAKAKIKVPNLDMGIVRLIEFIEKGSFLKVQDKDTKHAFVIPTSRIEYLELIEDKPDKGLIKKYIKFFIPNMDEEIMTQMLNRGDNSDAIDVDNEQK